MRSCEGIKMRDLESVLRSAGMGTSQYESSINQQNKNDETSKIEEPTSVVLSETLECTSTAHLEGETTCFTRGSNVEISSSTYMVTDAVAECNKNITKHCFSASPVKERVTHSLTSTGLDMGPNTMDVANTVEKNPFYRCKSLKQKKPSDGSECGSTAGILEENEPLRMWKKMKQNGFMSLHVGIPMPGRQACQSGKRKNDKTKEKMEIPKRVRRNRLTRLAAPNGLLSSLETGTPMENDFIPPHGGIPMPKWQFRQYGKRKNYITKKKIEIPKGDQINRFTKLAAPSGLLSSLDPGIIKHVRNSKQVHSILEAMLQSEEHGVQIQNGLTNQLGMKESKETDYTRKDHTCELDSALNQFIMSLDRQFGLSSNRKANISETDIFEKRRFGLSSGKEANISETDVCEKRFHHNASTSSKLTTHCNNDILNLKLSSGITSSSDNASSVSGDDFSVTQKATTSLSLKAASVASQWLELLQLDIEGRLAALRRSKERVRTVIQKELPCLLSSKLSSNLEDYSPVHPSGVECSISHMHATRWISLFSQMDRDLYEESKQLESWLGQVQDVRLHCSKGLRSISADGSSQLVSEASRRSKNLNEMECAVMAAAASIYSTCNLIMLKEDVPCF